MKIQILGPFLPTRRTCTGIATMAEYTIPAFQNHSIKCFDILDGERRYVQPSPDVTIINWLPTEFERLKKFNPAKHTIGWFTFEADRLPSSWVTGANTMDQIWTTSWWSKQMIEGSGVTVPVHVINPVVPSFKQTEKIKADKFTFTYIGDNILRKNIAGLIEAFALAFDGDSTTRLLIKTNGANSYMSGVVNSTLKNLNLRTQPDIAVLTDFMPERDMERLWSQTDCFVSLTHGEGFGLAQFEAAARGIPVITTNWGASKEFLFGSDLLVDSHMVHIPKLEKMLDGIFEPGMCWASPHQDSAIEKMRNVRQGLDQWGLREFYSTQADLIKENLHNTFSKDFCTAAVDNALAELENK